MLTRKTLARIKREKGQCDEKKFDSFSDAAIDRMIAEDPDLAPATETLPPLLTVRAVGRKLGLGKLEFARRLAIPIGVVRRWEHGEDEADPAIRALLRILDRIPEPALKALAESERKAG